MNWMFITTLILGAGTTPEGYALGRGLGLGCAGGIMTAGGVWLFKDPADSSLKVPFIASAIGLGSGAVFAGAEYAKILAAGEQTPVDITTGGYYDEYGNWHPERTYTTTTMTTKAIPYFCLGYSLAITPFILLAFLL